MADDAGRGMLLMFSSVVLVGANGVDYHTQKGVFTMNAFHPEQLVTELFTLLKQQPEGVTMDVTTLGAQEGNYYAIGGFVQEFDGFNALAYRIVDDLPALLNSEEFYGDIERRVSRHIDAIREHGSLGAWYTNGELFIDVVEAWECRGCSPADAEVQVGTTTRRLAIRKGLENNQDAIGHVCDRVAGGYEEIPLKEVA